MRTIRGITLALALGLTTGAAQAFSIGDAARMASGAVAPGSTTAQSADLLGRLVDLNVTSEQAIGGTGALLELASNQLPGTDYRQLLQSVPVLNEFSGDGDGLLGQPSAVGGLLGRSNPPARQSDASAGIHNLADVARQFSSLGMDPGLVSQFAPVLLQFIGSQGVGQPLLGSLAGIWGASAATP